MSIKNYLIWKQRSNAMNLFAKVRTELISILRDLFPDMEEFHHLSVEPPKDPTHGEMSTNAAMVLATKVGKKPQELAKILQERLQAVSWIQTIHIAGPGFINMTLDPQLWCEVLLEIQAHGIHFGNSDLGKKQKVNVEYVSANPTGPMHIGHARGAVYGDALASLLVKAGFDVTREYYINDAGAQVDTLARSVYLRYREALGECITIPEGLYPGDYLKPVGRALAEERKRNLLQQPESVWMPIVRPFAIAHMLQLIKQDLRDLGVKHDVFVSEKTLQDAGKIEEVMEILKRKELIYKGILEAPKGKKPEEWEPREQTLFKATQFGDDSDRPLQKSDGTYTYFASDIAYHQDKLSRGFNHMVLVLGADHGGYVKRLKAVVSALSNRQATVDVKISQLVNFLDQGVPIKMSKRKGSFTTVRDVIEEVGADVIRFIMLTRKNDVVLDFDLKVVKEQSKDNPVFYVQYAHARCHSVLRLAAIEAPKSIEMIPRLAATDLLALSDPSTLQLIKSLATWPRTVESAALVHEPHRIAFYLQEVASQFHALWNKGKDDAMLRFIVPGNIEQTSVRLLLVQAVAQVIASGLGVLGVKPVECMQ